MADERITYGNWLKPKSPGIGPLTLGGTVIGFIAMLTIMITISASKSIIAGLVEALIAAAFILVFTTRFDGRTLAARIADRLRFAQRQRRGETLQVGGALAALPATERHPMPGYLADAKVLNARDGRNTEFAALHYPNRDLYAVSFRCQPDGVGMVDRDVIDAQVAQYGAWLAEMSDEDGLVGATVTVDTAPSSGAALRESVLSQRSPQAPGLASEVMDIAVERLPTVSAEMVVYVTLVWRGAETSHGRKGAESVIVELARRLPAHIRSLAEAGAGEPVPMTEVDLAQAARSAYAPNLGEVIEQLREQGEQVDMSWLDAGPAFLDEEYDFLMHDGYASFSYEMMEPPKSMVFDNHLDRLVRPHSAFLRKRVTLMYRPLDIDKGIDQADRAVKSADFDAGKQKGRVKGRQQIAIRQAEQTENELGNGAALVPFSMLSTVTFEATDDASRIAENALKSLMRSTKMRARSTTGTQVAAFHATLPFGLLPWEFAKSPLWLKQVM